MTMKLYIKDFIKNLLLFVIFMPLILGIILYVIEWGGDNFYLYVKINFYLSYFLDNGNNLSYYFWCDYYLS